MSDRPLDEPTTPEPTTPEPTSAEPTSAELAELSERSSQFESATPGEIVEWANDRFDSSLVLACSFQDLVLLDIATAVNPKIDVVFIDTGAHFRETLEFVEMAKERYELNLIVTAPAPGSDLHPCGSKRCCEFRKVAPLRGVLSGYEAWVTSLKRVDSPTRSEISIVGYDDTFGLVKINPLATWSDEDVYSYINDHDLANHPLFDKGYLSIGCEPTTRAVMPGDDPRAGRWSGTAKTECGLHVAHTLE